MRRRLMRWVAPALLGATLTAAACAPPPAPAAPPASASRVVLVSGRDDHGLLALHEVPLYAAPGGGAETGRVHDGGLARVLEARGQWLRVRGLDAGAEGWVDDYYLRDRALRLAGSAVAGPERWGAAPRLGPAGQVVLVDAAPRDGALWAAIRPVADAAAAPEWVPATQLLEVGARPGAADAHHRI